MNRAYLVKVNDSLNQKRFYSIHVTKTIFEDWAVIREWGRIGSPGTVREEWFEDEPQALKKANSIVKHRVRRGYCLKIFSPLERHN